MPLCFDDHARIHSIGIRRFAEKFDGAHRWLKAHGWYQNAFGKWRGPMDCYTDNHRKIQPTTTEGRENNPPRSKADMMADKKARSASCLPEGSPI